MAAFELVVGRPAADFELLAANGKRVRLSGFHGRRVVVYFYPKDNTEGCTLEAADFRDRVADFEQLSTAVIGISPDSPESHAKFGKKLGLNFPLLSDPDHAVAETYGLWVEKQLYGRKFWGVQRATFLIGPDGTIEHIWPKVRPKGHAQAVLDVIRRVAAT